MKKQQAMFLVLLSLFLSMVFFGCDAMATLFHGPEPEAQPVTYTVTFEANGATGTPPAVQTVTPGTSINLPVSGGLIRTGYVFIGWNESLGGGIGTTTFSVGSSISVNKNMLFYAQWLDESTPQYTVIFNANGASGSPPDPQTVYSGVSITIPNQRELVYSGRVFDGWNTQANGSGETLRAGDDYSVISNITLYAMWEEVEEVLEVDLRTVHAETTTVEIHALRNRVIIIDDGVERVLRITVAQRSAPLTIELRNVNAVGPGGSDQSSRAGGPGVPVISMDTGEDNNFAPVPDLTIISSGSSNMNRLEGGRGRNGDRGRNADTSNSASSGGRGGKGGAAIIAQNFTIRGDANITLKGGDGGNGGNGGNGSPLRYAGSGGNGGDGGISIDTGIDAGVITIDMPGRTVSVLQSNGGNRGNRGTGGLGGGSNGTAGKQGLRWPETRALNILAGSVFPPP